MNRKEPTANSLSLGFDRLVLRPVKPEDASTLHRISNEPGARRYLWDDEPVEEATIREIIPGSILMFSEEGIGLFGVRRRGSEDLLGFCGFVRLEGMEEPELVYELTQRAWGDGLATEASMACLHYAFKDAVMGHVIAGTDEGNVASLRVIEKLGMQPVGCLNANAPQEPYYVVYRENFHSDVGRSKRWK